MDKRKVVFARLSRTAEIMLDDITTYNEMTQNGAVERALEVYHAWLFGPGGVLEGANRPEIEE